MTVHKLQAPGGEEEFAVRCNAPGCDLELAAPTEAEALGDAALAGFKFEPGSPHHVCIECQRGKNPVLAQLAAAAQAGASLDPGSSTPPPADPNGWLN